MRGRVIAIALLLTASSAAAEVCAVFNAAREFVRLDIVTDEEVGIIWSKLSAAPDNTCLNLDGDLLRDRMPTHTVIAMPDEPLIGTGGRSRLGPERPGRLTPVVAWPRTDGSDWEIIYAIWDFANERWTVPAHVDRIENFADDFDPSIGVVDDQLKLVWTHSTPTETVTLGSDGTVMTIGYHHDILWSPPYIIHLGPVDPLEQTSLPVGTPLGLGLSPP